MSEISEDLAKWIFVPDFKMRYYFSDKIDCWLCEKENVYGVHVEYEHSSEDICIKCLKEEVAQKLEIQRQHQDKIRKIEVAQK